MIHISTTTILVLSACGVSLGFIILAWCLGHAAGVARVIDTLYEWEDKEIQPDYLSFLRHCIKKLEDYFGAQK